MISIPFSGSKRYSYKHVKPIVSLGQYGTVYEPFGGSGVLSVNLWNDGVVSHAVVNDYDHFFDEYETYLDLKDLVVEKCLNAGLKKRNYRRSGGGYFDDRLLNKSERLILQNIIQECVPARYWNYMAEGNNFVFGSVNTHDKVVLNDFACFTSDLTTTNQRAYLHLYRQLQIEHLDYRDFLDKFSYDSRSLLLVDPPYIGTSMGQYAGQFKDGDTEELIDRLKQTGCDFIFFNHELKQVQEWLKGFDAEYFVTGRKNRPDIMAYVKQ